MVPFVLILHLEKLLKSVFRYGRGMVKIDTYRLTVWHALSSGMAVSKTIEGERMRIMTGKFRQKANN